MSKQVEVELKVCEWCKMPPETWAEPGEPHTAAVRCVNTECPVRSAGWVSPGFWNTRLPVASTAPGVGDGVRKLTLPEINHLLALLEAERESGEYAGPREQYYARTERLIKWCSDQIGEK